jgi:uncharacterized protein
MQTKATDKELLKKILMSFKKDIRRLYPNNLNALVLYGSYARGTAKFESDVDLLLVLNELKSPYREITNTSTLTTDYLLKYGINISLLPTDRERFSKSDLSFYRNVRQEGVLL